MSNSILDLEKIHLSVNFLTEVISKIDDALQIKVLLFSIWLAEQSGDLANPLCLADFYTYPEFTDQLGNTALEIRENLLAALRANIHAGFLIVEDVDLIEDGFAFFLNSDRGEQALHLQGNQQYVPLDNAQNQPQKGLIRLYEENIGPLTPLIADMLKDAEKEFPEQWLQEAIQIAVANNVRKWRYIEAILKSWKEEGRDGRDQRHTEEDYKQYTQGKYGKFIKNR
ncbi:MAG TPA: hypothetical protein DCK95_11300 [Anaerolineaceae bacterium]|uniref:DnaB/C C-terminal domain-containing protein n=1 Tax=Anaerolinea thermophila TaxID=167964 RepID=A0A101FYV1_9CHLR|nr:MAG: hypothetical protein XD73_0251 [Anaerolinea thermophila]HAF62894.1 hypothetical protein [Anaerolineaceae bacterium]